MCERAARDRGAMKSGGSRKKFLLLMEQNPKEWKMWWPNTPRRENRILCHEIRAFDPSNDPQAISLEVICEDALPDETREFLNFCATRLRFTDGVVSYFCDPFSLSFSSVKRLPLILHRNTKDFSGIRIAHLQEGPGKEGER